MKQTTIRRNIKNGLKPTGSNSTEPISPLTLSDSGKLRDRLNTLEYDCEHSNPLLIKPGVYEPTQGQNPEENTTLRNPTLPNEDTWKSSSANPDHSFYDTTIDLSNHYLVALTHERNTDTPSLYWIEVNNHNPPQRANRDFSISLYGQENSVNYPLNTFIRGIHAGFIYPLLYIRDLDHPAGELKDALIDIFKGSMNTMNSETQYIKDAQKQFGQSYKHAKSENNISVKQQKDRHNIETLPVTTKIGPIDLTNYTGVRTHTFGKQELRTYEPLVTSSGHPIVKTERTTMSRPPHTHVYSLKSFIAHIESMQLTLCTFDATNPPGSVTEFNLTQATKSYQIDSA